MSIERSSSGLRDHLFSVLEALEKGSRTPQDVIAASKAAAQINNSARIDQEYARFISEQRTHTKTPLSLTLVTEIPKDVKDMTDEELLEIIRKKS